MLETSRQVKLACDICGGDDPADYQMLYPLEGTEVVRCRRCGLVYVNAPFDPAIYDGDDYWAEEAYEENGESFTDEALGVIRRIERYVQKGRLIDVGCGFGYFVKAAADQGWNACGVELNRRVAASATERWSLPIFGGDLSEAEFANESFDCVTLFNVIEHLLRPSEVVRDAAALLRPGGLLVIETPSEDGLPKKVHRLVYGLGLGNFAHEFYQWGGHHHSFSARSLGHLLEKFGLEICHKESLVSPLRIFASKQLLRIRESHGVREKLRPLLAMTGMIGVGPLMQLTGTGNRIRVYARKAEA